MAYETIHPKAPGTLHKRVDASTSVFGRDNTYSIYLPAPRRTAERGTAELRYPPRASYVSAGGVWLPNDCPLAALARKTAASSLRRDAPRRHLSPPPSAVIPSKSLGETASPTTGPLVPVLAVPRAPGFEPGHPWATEAVPQDGHLGTPRHRDGHPIRPA